MDQNGKVLLSPRFDLIEDFFLYDDIARVRTGDKWGVVDRLGHLLLEPEYEDVRVEDEFVAARLQQKWGFLDKKGKWLFSPQFDAYDRYANLTLHKMVYTVKKNGKWGTFDPAASRIVIPPLYDEMDYDDVNDTFRVRKGTLWGAVTANGTMIVPAAYSSIEPFQDGVAAVEKNGKWGYINRQGKLVIPLQFQYGYGFANGSAIVKKNNRWGVIDKNGKVVIPFIYNNLVKLSFGLAATRIKDKWVVVQKGGQPISDTLFDDVRDEDGLVKVTAGGQAAYLLPQNNRYTVGPMFDEIKYSYASPIRKVRKGAFWGWMDNSGKVVVQPVYDAVNEPSEGLVAVNKDGKWGYCSLQGTVVIPLRYDEVRPVSKGRARINIDGKWGMIRADGSLLIPNDYDQLSEDDETGLFVVEKDGKTGVLDQHGKPIVPPVYDDVMISKELVKLTLGSKVGFYDVNSKTTTEPQFDGLLFTGYPDVLTFQKGDKWGAITVAGKVIIPPVYDEIAFDWRQEESRVARVRLQQKWGYVDTEGKEIAPPIYEEVGPFREGIGPVKQNGKWGYISGDGQLMTGLIFDEAEPFEDGLGKVRWNGHVTYVNRQGAIVYQPVDSVTTYRFTYEPFEMKYPAILSILPDLTENTDPAYQAARPRVQEIRDAYYTANGPFTRGFQIDSYSLAPETLLLEIYTMLGTLEPVPSDNVAGGETFVDALVNAGYVNREEMAKGISSQFVAHVLYNIFHEANPSKGLVKLADTKDPALLWAVEKGIPGFAKDSRNRLVTTGGSYASEYRDALTFCAQMFKFPQAHGEPRYYPYKIRDAADFQASDNLIHRQLLVNGIRYEIILRTRPELEQNPAFLAAREKAKEKLLQETEASYQRWLAAQRLQVAAR
nr:WG repeat-containing protein [Brevibacillus sp. SYP-B805]